MFIRVSLGTLSTARTGRLVGDLNELLEGGENGRIPLLGDVLDSGRSVHGCLGETDFLTVFSRYLSASKQTIPFSE